jgi:hypothetical protein
MPVLEWLRTHPVLPGLRAVRFGRLGGPNPRENDHIASNLSGAGGALTDLG